MVEAKSKGADGGFTLLELLIAIVIFTILTTITYSGLKAILDTEQQTTAELELLSKLQLSFNLIQRDLEQAVLRPVRDEFGDSQPPLRSGDYTGLALEFTHGGYPNPIGLPRSDLQRVAYQLEDQVFYRITWPFLDRAQETEARRTALFEKVKDLTIIFYDQTMKPQETWPPTTPGTGQTPPPAMPKALELVFEFERIGRVRRLFRMMELP